MTERHDVLTCASCGGALPKGDGTDTGSTCLDCGDPNHYVKCGQCRQLVITSDRAPLCPLCGKPAMASGGLKPWHVVVALALVFGGWAAFRSNSPEKPDSVGAERACRDFVLDRLKAPRSADFTDTRVAKATDGDEQYRVTGAVDADNSFGAQIRNRYTCEVRWDGEDWTLVDVNLVGP